MTDAPEPFTPPACDLRDFPKIMIDVGRLFASSFNATASSEPMAWMIGHKLWYRSWHQVPAASLPNNDGELAHLAELGGSLRTFTKIKPLAMRGWVLCRDGRLYHAVVAEAALEAWITKLGQRKASSAGTASRYGGSFDPADIDAQIVCAVRMLRSINPATRAVDRLARRQSRPQPKAEGGGQ